MPSPAGERGGGLEARVLEIMSENHRLIYYLFVKEFCSSWRDCVERQQRRQGAALGHTAEVQGVVRQGGVDVM